MSQTPQKANWAPVLVLGSLWGLSEAALGMYCGSAPRPYPARS
jgi:hypothetical protein